MEENCFLDRLPDELLVRLFSWLPTSDLVSIYRLQNKRMKNLALDKSLTRCLDFTSCYGLEDAALLEFLRSCTAPKILSLAHCYQLKLTPILKVIRQYEHLAILDLTTASLSVAVLTHVLDSLPSLEGLGLCAVETVPLDKHYRPLPPFSKSTMAALARLKHFKYVMGHKCIRNSLLPCIKNVESVVLDFMPFEQVHDHCSCCFFIRTPFLSPGIGSLRTVFAPRWVLNETASHMFLGATQTYLRNGFVPHTRSCNEAVCLRQKHSCRSREAAATACDLEPTWTAFVRKDVLDRDISSPFISTHQGDSWEPISVNHDSPEEQTQSSAGQSKAVRYLRICCFPEVAAQCSQKQWSLLDGIHGNQALDVLEIVIGPGRDRFVSHYDKRLNAIDRYDRSPDRSNTQREYFDDLLQLIRDSPHLRKVSVTASHNPVKLKKFLVNLSTTSQRLESFSVEFSKSYLNLQLPAHLNLVLPNMKHLQDLRIDSSYFQLNPHFVRSVQQCSLMKRICILTRGGKCFACQKLPSLFISCERLMFLCLDGFTEHDPCSHKQAKAIAAAIKQRFGATRPGLVVSHSWRSRPGIPNVHFAEMVANRGLPR